MNVHQSLLVSHKKSPWPEKTVRYTDSNELEIIVV